MVNPFRRRAAQRATRRRPPLHEAADAELIAALIDGHPDALDELIARLGTAVRSLVGHLVPDASWADDVTQEVFVRVLESANRYDSRWPLSVWVLRIARNLCVDLLRREDAGSRAVARIQDDRTVAARSTPREAASPHDELERAELQTEFERCVDRLPENFRTAFVLREIEGLRYEEIAAIMQTTVKTVSTRLHRARLLLRQAMSRYLGETDGSPA